MLKETLVETHGLSDEQADSVLGYHTETLAGFIPKAKYEAAQAEIAATVNRLNERDRQLADLKKEAAKSGDTAELQQKLDTAIAQNKLDNETAAKELAELKLSSAVDLALTKEGAKNVKAVKALLDLSTVKLDGDSVLGLQDQLTAIKEKEGYMFNPAITGREPYKGARGNADEHKGNPFKQETFNLTEQGRLFKEDPELYKKLKAAAGK